MGHWGPPLPGAGKEAGLGDEEGEGGRRKWGNVIPSEG